MKQKILPLLLALLTAYLPASAYDFMTDDGLCYNINSDGTSVTVTYLEIYPNYPNLSGDLSIPTSVIYGGTAYLVTSIGQNAFLGCHDLTSVTIPNSVITIGLAAFRDCWGLTEVSIPNSVTTIDRQAFYICRNLASISIPNSVTTIGEFAFAECNSLTSVTIPNSVTEIGGRTFYGSGLTSVTIPNSITSIGDWAFCNCYGLTSVTIPNSVTSIGEGAFAGCSYLTSVSIPNSVTSIGYNAFYNCIRLRDFYTYIENPSSVSLGSDVFMNVRTSTCLLHVPGGTAELYRAADQWSAFTNIVEDMTSIDNIATDHKSDGIYYNLLGQPVKNPTTGIYIYNGKKVFKK